MTPLEVLQAARDLISDPDHWCQGHYALDANGDPVEHRSPDAVRRCTKGALMAVVEGGAWIYAEEALFSAMNTADADEVEFNDAHTHAEVLAAFDRAIEMETTR